jgi:hypothetical protein
MKAHCPPAKKRGAKGAKGAKAHSSRVDGGGFQRPLPKKPKSIPRKSCSLIRIDLTCSHRRREQHALLEVVPKGSRGGRTIELAKAFEAYVKQGGTSHGDSLTLKAVMHDNCGRHPLWHVKDAGGGLVKRANGEKITCELAPPHVSRDEVASILGAWWLKGIKPRRYSIECEDHAGGSRHATVVVYPDIESGISINLGSPKGGEKWAGKIKQYKNLVKKVTRILDRFVPNLDDLEVEALEGQVALENTWAEEASTNRVHWEAEIAVKLDPVVSAAGKIKIKPSFIPGFITKYVADAYFYFSLKGEITAGGHFKWKGGGAPEGKGSVGGAVGLTVGGHVALGSKALGFDISGGTKLIPECSLKGTSEPQIELEGGLTWKPLKVRVTIELAFGLFDVHKDWDFFGEMTLVHLSYDLLS